MTEQGPPDRDPGAAERRCPACGNPAAADDRYCAECGAPLAGRGAEDGGRRTEERTPALGPESRGSEASFWVFAAKPTAVIGGGFLLLLLAAALLWLGQRDTTGTIVMLSICVAPLALLTIAIGVVRAVARRPGVGGQA